MAGLLLLIDDRVRSHDVFVTSVKDNAIPIVFDALTDTYATLMEKIRAAVAGKAIEYSTVGIIQHGSALNPAYGLLTQESVALLNDGEAMESWAGLVGFFAELKRVVGVATVDLITCAIYANQQWVAALNYLEAQTGMNFRASRDATGNLASGGNWTMESDNVNIEGLYFTDAIREYKGVLLYRQYYNSNKYMVSAVNTIHAPMVSASNPVYGMTRIIGDGSVITWGSSTDGGNSSAVTASLAGGVVAIASNVKAFAAIKSGGSVVTWGAATHGGDSSSVAASLTSGVKAIASTSGVFGPTVGGAFAALKEDGSVVTWGYGPWGGNSSTVSASLTGGVVAIAATDYAFAALKADGSVVTWGEASYGGDSSTLTGGPWVEVASNQYSFVVRNAAGGIATWGAFWTGGSLPTPISSGVVTIVSTGQAFTVLKYDGSIYAWGNSSYGGSNPNITSGVIAIASTTRAFAALMNDGSVRTWGDSLYGGDGTYTPGFYSSPISIVDRIATGVVALASNSNAFAALKQDGSVVTWGDGSYGGNSEAVASNITSDIISIASTSYAFAALKSNGSVVTWGNGYGGNSGDVTNSITSNVTSVYSSDGAFVAVKTDGSAIVWGENYMGGSSTSVAGSLTSGVLTVASTSSAFAALRGSNTISATTNTPDFGGTTTLSVISPDAGVTYQWYKNITPISGASGSSYTISNAIDTHHNGIYFVRRILGGSVADSNGIIITVSVPATPTVTIQPVVGEIVQTKSFTLTASSLYTPVSYQWIKDDTIISGETGASLTINAADAAADNGVYKVRQIIGSYSSDSNGITVSVIPLPVIAQNPETIIAGQSFTLSVTSPHGGATYNWYKNGVVIDGASGTSYTTNGGLVAGNDGEYTVRMTIGGTTAESSSLNLVITAPSAPVITASTQTPAYLGEFTFSVTSPYANAAFQWYKNDVAIDGVSSTSYSISEAKALSDDGSYTVRQTIGGYILDSNAISITVGSPTAPEISADNLQPAYQHSFTLSITASITGATYIWYRNGVAIDGATATSYFVEKATTLQNAGSHNVIMTLDGKNITSNTLDISIYYPPVVVSFTVYTDSIQNTIASPPYGIPPYRSEFSLYLYPVFDGATYTWFRDGVEIPGITSDRYTVASASALTHDGNYTVIMHLDGQDFTDTGSKRIVVGPPVSPIIVTTTQSPSYAGSFTLSVSNLDDLGSYQWYKDGTILEGATSGSYTIDGAIPRQNSGTYKVKIAIDGKNLESDSISITVGTPPMPVISATSLTPKYGSPLVLTVTDPLSSVAYQWYREDTPIINASSTSYEVDNAVGSQYNGTYSVRMVADGQQYESNTLDIAVSVASEIVSNPSIDSIIFGQSFTLSVSSVVPSATYQWYKNTVAIDGATASSYSVDSATVDDHAGAYYVKTYLDGFDADSNTLNINVIIPPFITQQPTDDPIFVDDETLAYKIATMFTNGMAIISTITMTVVSPNATSYQWYRSGLPIFGATSPSYTVSSGAIGVYSYYVSVSNAAGTIPSRTAMINITRPLALGEISNKIRTLPVVSFIQQDISSTLILDYSQQNPEYDLSYIRVTLTQNTGATYTNSSGQQVRLNETYVKVFWPADILFSAGDSVTAPRLYGMLQLDTFYHNCSYNIAVDVYFNDGQGTGWSGSVVNTDTQYVAAEQTVKPAVVVYDSSTHNVPELRVNIQQLLVQKVRGSWDDGNVVHMRVIVDDLNSVEQAKIFEVSRPFYYETGDNDTRTVNGYPLVLGAPDIAFGNTYHISASIIYRDGTSTGGDVYIVSNFNNPPEPLNDDQVRIDLYQYLVSNTYTSTVLSNGYPYYNSSLEYIRSESQIENRLSEANKILSSWGAITEPTSHATVIEKILEVIDADTIESTRSFNINGAGYLYLVLIWMLLDTNVAAASLLYIKKYVVGMLMLIEFNTSNSTEILTGQFKDDSTKKFHKIIRLDRYWNTLNFPDQLSRIDEGAFNTSCKIVMREKPSSYTSFDVDGLGNIVLDPIHFPHILNKKADPYNLDTYYSDKLFLIGHALMPGAPHYMSFNKKIVDMCDNHVFNLSGDAIYDLSGVRQIQFQNILSNVIINRTDYTYDWKSSILYNSANLTTYKAIHTFFTPIAVGGVDYLDRYLPASVFDTNLNTWNYTEAIAADYDNWYVSYIPPNYFRNSDITESIVSWKNTATPLLGIPLLRDTIYIGANAFPPTCTLSLPAPYLDNALLGFKDTSLPGGSVLDIINAYVPPSSAIIVKENGGLITLQSTVNTLPMNYFTRMNLTYININIDRPLLRIPPGSLPMGCNVMRNGISGTVLPGSYGQPYSQGMGPSVYIQELANMSTDLVMYSGIVYKNYDVDGSCEILWIIDFFGKDITFPPVPLTVYDYWGVGCKDIYIPNAPFKCGASMFLLLAGKVYYSGISYKLFNPSGSTLTYDRVPTMADSDKLTGTVRILDTGASGNYYIKNLPDIFKAYTGISVIVLPPTMNIDINSMIDGQVFDCDGITWNHNKTLGYPVLVTLPATKQQVLCLPYVKFYDSIFENAINIISVSNAAGYTIAKAVGKKAFKNCSSLVNFNYYVGEIEDEAFYGTASLKSLVFDTSLSRIGSRAFYGSGIETIVIEASPSVTLTDSTFEGASQIKTLTVRNITSTFSTAAFAGLTSLKTLILQFSDSANATVDVLNVPNLETVSLLGGVVAVGSSVFQGCSKLKSVTINGRLSNLSDLMFAGTQDSLEYLYVNFVGDSVINCQFNNFTKLKEVRFMGSGKATLHVSPFTGCSSLQTYVNTLLIDSNMSDSAFGGCAALKEISLTFKDNSTRKTVSSAFAGLSALERFAITGPCTLTSSTILPNSTQLKYIEINGELAGSITATGMTSVETFIVKYSSDVSAEIADFAFKDNSVLTTVTILGGLKSIGMGAFYNCSALTSITLPAGLEEIHDYAFARTGITGEIIIPASVTLLGDAYFLMCPNITKITYQCPVLFFIDPTQLTTRAWDIISKPNNTTLDISGQIQLTIGDMMTSFSYTDLTTNTRKILTSTQLKRSIIKEKETERLTSIRNCLLNLQDLHGIMSTALNTETNNANATALVNNISTIDILVRDVASVAANAAAVNDKIDIAVDLSTHLIAYNLPVTYSFIGQYGIIANAYGGGDKLSSAIVSLNTAISADNDMFGPAYDTISQSDIALYNISPVQYTLEPHVSVTFPSDQIEKIDGLNRFDTISGVTYLNVTEEAASILLQDNTALFVSGTIKINLNEHLGIQLASIVGYCWDNMDNTDNDTSVDFVFSGSFTSVMNLSNQANSSIIITSASVIIYDCAMKYLTNSYVEITTPGTVKLYDNAFGMWKNSQLRIQAMTDVIVGKDIFLGSDFVMVHCNKPLINKPVIKLVYMSGKTLHDISGIISSECGFEATDTRFTKIGTYIPEDTAITCKGVPLITFQRLSTLTYYTLIGQPEDWFWCNRINPQMVGVIDALPYDFSAGSKKYLYLPETYSYDQTGAIQPEEYFGLTHSFAPNIFSYNGKKWKRLTSKNTGSNVLLRAIYTNNQPYASLDRQEQNGIKFLKNLAIEMAISVAFSIATAFVPVAAPAIFGVWMARAINVARTVGLTAAELVATDYATRTIVRVGGLSGIGSISAKRISISPMASRAGKTVTEAAITETSGKLLSRISISQSSKSIRVIAVHTAAGTVDNPVELKLIVEEIDSLFEKAVIKISSPTAITKKVTRARAPVTQNASVETKIFSSGKQKVSSATVEKVVTKKSMSISTKVTLPAATKLTGAKLGTKLGINPFKIIVPTNIVNTAYQAAVQKFFKSLAGEVQNTLLTYSVMKVFTEVISSISNIFITPLANGNTPKYVQRLITAMYAIQGVAGGIARSVDTANSLDSVIIDILTYMMTVMSGNTSSLDAFISFLQHMKDADSTYNVQDVDLYQLAAYNSLMYHDTAETDRTGNVIIEDDMVNATIKAAALRTPPFSTPQCVPSQYTESPADRLQHYIRRGTVYAHPPEMCEKYVGSEMPAGTYQNPCRVITVANPLNTRTQYMWRSTFCGMAMPASNPQTDSYGNNTILVVNPRLDEVYLGNRPVSYAELSDNEEPNSVFCGATNISVNVPDGTNIVPDYAYCSTDGTDGNMPFTFNNLVLPSTLRTIGKRAFYRTSLNSCVIPSGIQAIAAEAFRNSSLTNVVFLESYNTLTNLTNVRVALNSGSKLAASNEKALTLTNIVASYAAHGGVNVTATPTQFMTLNNISLFSVTNVASVTVLDSNKFTTEYVGPLTITITQSDDTNTFYVEDNKLIFRNFNRLSASLTGVTSKKLYSYGSLVSTDTGFSTWGYYNNLNYKDKQFTIVVNADSNGSVLSFPSLPSAFVGVVNNTVSRQPASRSRSTGMVIGDNAFSNTNLTTVAFPPSIERFGANIFENCPIREIVFTGPPPPLENIDLTFFEQLPAKAVLTIPPEYAQETLNLITAAKELVPSLNVVVRLDSSSVPTFPSIGGQYFMCPTTTLMYSSASVRAFAAGRSVPSSSMFVSWLPLGVTVPGMFFRRLGRIERIYKIQPTRRGERPQPVLKYIFQEIQLVGGAGSEGVSGSAGDIDPYCTGWVCTFSSDGQYPIF